MANYTITRHTEPSHVYGCTNFSTFQQVGQIAEDGGALDSTVVWDIKANPGYTLDLSNFDIAGTRGTSVPDDGQNKYREALPGSSPYSLWLPILGAHMEQISSVLIRIVFHLAPNAAAGIVGNTFQMPNGDVQTQVKIEGCADVAGEGVNIRFVKNCIDSVTVVEIDKELDGFLIHEQISSTIDQISGTLESTSISASTSGADLFIGTYTVTAATGKAFAAMPILSSITQDYYYTTTYKTAINHNDDGQVFINQITYSIYKYN
jgi:hypothetical protein